MLTFWFLASFLAATLGAAEDEGLPFSAFVAVIDAEVRSGPGESYYPTERLPLGAEVEVHRRDPGGWLAIRPPADSFCWLPASKVKLTDHRDVAEVIADDAVAWMGSNLESVKRHRWQVRLERGERVAILSSDQRDDARDGAPRTWYRIAAPAGEFRWIHQDDVQRSRPGRAATRPAATAAARPAATAPPAPRRVVPAESGERTEMRVEPKVESPPSQWVAARKRAPAEIQPAAYQTADAVATDPPANRTAAPALSPAPAAAAPLPASGDGRVIWTARNPRREAQQIDRLASSVLPGVSSGTTASAAAAAAAAAPAFPPTSGISRSEAEIERGDIEVQLSLMVSREPTLWNLPALRGRAEALVERSASPLERGQARLLLEQIEDWEDLYERHVQAERGVVVPAAGGGGTGAAGAPPSLARLEPRFDGAGWLVPVHSTKRSAPPYAISDDTGKVLYYVSPAPGVNLHRYERKRVGIYGQRNTSPELTAQVLTAHRVVDLERHTTR